MKPRSARGLACLAVSFLIVAAGERAGALDERQRTAAEHTPGLLVDFLAVAADGMPVAELQASEVEVRLNNRVRKLRSLKRVSTAPQPSSAAAAALPPPYGTNNGVTVGRSMVLIVDEESFIGGREQPLRNAVDGLLDALTPSDRVMVVALPYGGVKTPFTSDPTRVRLAMAGLSGQASRDETGSDMACRTRTFLETLDGFLRGLAARSTPLTVVVFTGGLSAPRRDAPMALAPGKCEVLVNHFERAMVAAGAARANFYVVQPPEMTTRPPGAAKPTDAWTTANKQGQRGWTEGIAGTDYLGSDNPLEGIEHLAGATGAARLALDATGKESLVPVATETSAYYVAEIEPERGEIYGRSRPLGVRVLREGVIVRARPEITFTEPRRGEKALRLAVEDLLVSGEAFTDLQLRVGGFTVRDAKGQLRVGIVVETVDPASSLSSVGAMLVEPTGRIVGRWFAPDAAERPLLGAVAATPGTYRLRVAAIDAQGRPGVAEEVVEAGLVTVGPLSLGSMMFGVSRKEGMSPQLEFTTEPTAIASFDIYGGAAGMGLAAIIEVARTTDGQPIVTLPLSLSRAGEDRVSATTGIPIGALPPGDYIVRGVIQLQDGSQGRVQRTLRKAPGGS
ncbi:MAG: hypothetical protein ACE148_08835 [Vicinamibacterales bacterium]